MSDTGIELTRHQIQVASGDEAWTTAATQAAFTAIAVDLAAVTDRAQLVHRVAAAFRFPYRLRVLTP